MTINSLDPFWIESSDVMTAKYLYELIDSLSSDQRRILTGFLKKSFGETTNLFLLYSRIKKRKPYTDNEENRIRGKEFKSHDLYYQTRERLARAIIRCFLKEKVSPIAFIKKAIEFDAVDQAWKTLIQQLELAEKEEKYSYMLQLYDLLQELKSSMFPGFSEVLPDHIANRKNVVILVSEILELEQFLDQLRKAIKLPFQTRSLLHQRIIEQLPKISSSSPRIDFLKGKVSVYLSILMGNYASALEGQIDLLHYIQKWQKLAFPDKVKEYSSLIQLCLIERRRDDAIRYSMEISSLEACNRRDKRLVKWSAIHNKVSVSEQFCIIGLSTEAQQDLDSNKDVFARTTYSKLTYSGALVAFYCQDYSKGIDRINKINFLSSEERGELTWQLPVLLLAVHFKMGSVDILDHLILSAIRACKNTPLDIPMRIVKMIRKLSGLLTVKQRNAILLKEIEEVGFLVTSKPDEKRATNFFNYPLWLKSELENVSIADLISTYMGENNNANLSNAIG